LILPIQWKNLSIQHLTIQRFIEPKISLLEKIYGTHLKFEQFDNEIYIITFFQPQSYPTNELRLRLVRTLLTRQVLFWFAPLFEKRTPILNNFELFLATFAKAFG